ncbi:helix-turn-helix domain-containing protein [Bradyrhizobium sp. AUGA SZCCT0160]|uniref:helix-turn-helix domain-containing protein n=1 Tax=Bradyrhizobium sp. AUGA SZCCT0160 TaxID=2807662 RepID=UPI002010FB9A|nr:helix-turn-helix domain-containing protein [Bradyrhizobium sp. AUGA SZCCT0160]
MLGVRRTSVTAVARTLQETGLIKYARGKIQIVDAEALQASACECYGFGQDALRKAARASQEVTGGLMRCGCRSIGCMASAS